MKQYPLHSLPAETFEELCRDLATAELGNIMLQNGGRGFQQRGVDVIGYQPGTGNVTVIECKRYQNFTVRLLNDALSRFQEHGSFWKKHKVRTIVLCVTADPPPDAIPPMLAWVRRFTRQGVQLHVWSLATLQCKLQDNSRIATRYFGPPIVPNAVDGSVASSASYFRTSRTQRRLFLLLDRFGFNHFASVAVEDDPTFTLEFQNFLLESCNAALSKGTARPGVGLAVCRDILDSGTFARSWKYRRAFSRTLGISLAAAAQLNRGTLRQDVVARALTSPEGAIALAAALTERTATARLAPASTWQLLIGHKHPQVRWSISRGWPFVAEQLGDSDARLIEQETFRAPDDWVRRRLILTFLRRANGWRFHHSKDRTLARSLLREELNRDRGSDFVTAVRAWLAPTAPESFDEFFRITGPDVAANPRARASIERAIKTVGDELSVFCLRLDATAAFRRRSTQYQSTPEGRYGAIKQYLATVLSENSSLETYELVTDLLDRSDEGIRWAVIALAGRWLPNLTSEEAHTTVTRALEDEHPWVVREMLTVLGARTTQIAKDNTTLMDLAMRRMLVFAGAGWDLEEFVTPLMQASGRFPAKQSEL